MTRWVQGKGGEGRGPAEDRRASGSWAAALWLQGLVPGSWGVGSRATAPSCPPLAPSPSAPSAVSYLMLQDSSWEISLSLASGRSEWEPHS